VSEASLEERIRADLNTARRARDARRLSLLGTLLAEIKNRRIELGRDLTDEDVQAIVGTAIKRRREAADQMSAGGREELAEKERWEGDALQEYLPPQLEESDVREMVREAVAEGAGDIGGVMKAVIPRVKGRFEGKEVNRIAREELQAAS